MVRIETNSDATRLLCSDCGSRRPARLPRIARNWKFRIQFPPAEGDANHQFLGDGDGGCAPGGKARCSELAVFTEHIVERVGRRPGRLNDSLPAINPTWGSAPPHPATVWPPTAPPDPLAVWPSLPARIMPPPRLAVGWIGQGGAGQHPCDQQDCKFAHGILHRRQSWLLTLV
jgi:hypothetical protein